VGDAVIRRLAGTGFKWVMRGVVMSVRS
jgi:hypothetical protein